MCVGGETRGGGGEGGWHAQRGQGSSLLFPTPILALRISSMWCLLPGVSGDPEQGEADLLLVGMISW